MGAVPTPVNLFPVFDKEARRLTEKFNRKIGAKAPLIVAGIAKAGIKKFRLTQNFMKI